MLPEVLAVPVRSRPVPAVLLVLALLAAACGAGDAEATPDQGAGVVTPAETATVEPTPEETTAEPSEPTAVGLAPLTGAPVTDPAALERPVIAVKVENTKAARPQAGLDVADIVYEELTEGGVTRFAALFQSQVPDQVGPIRSGRPEDAKVLPAYDPMLFTSGARPDVIDRIRSAGLTFTGEERAFMYRDSGRSAPHDVFAVGQDLFDAAVDRGVPTASALPWTFSDEVPAGGTPAAALDVAMSSVARTGWEYDAGAGLYRRLQNGVAQVVTGPGRVGAANVVIVGVTTFDGGCCDPAGNRLTETEVVGSGRAIVLRDGRRFDASWSKASPGEHLRLASPDGSSLPLKPGPTWILLAPVGNLPAAS